MKPLDVYPVYDIEPVRGKGTYVWDKTGTRYLDFYGGHAVISIGHSHPHYVERINEQLGKIGFYSNSVKMPIQEECASLLGKVAGHESYDLFFCNSGAEATENAIKVAAFNNPGNKIIVFEKGFHGRTSMAVSCTDNAKIRTQFDNKESIVTLPLNDVAQLEAHFDDQICAVMVEGIQGIGGIHVPTNEFLSAIRRLCDQHNAVFIMDEIQSGFGRSGHFFAHQRSGVSADVITMAKGMGNGFPVGGILVKSGLEHWKGMLGSTFGGNHLACAATLAVLEVMETEALIANAASMGQWLKEKLAAFDEIKEIRGEGLMLGLVFDEPIADLRKQLVFEHHVFTGSASDPKVLRLLPPLSVSAEEAQEFTEKFEIALKTQKQVAQ